MERLSSRLARIAIGASLIFGTWGEIFNSYDYSGQQTSPEQTSPPPNFPPPPNVNSQKGFSQEEIETNKAHETEKINQNPTCFDSFGEKRTLGEKEDNLGYKLTELKIISPNTIKCVFETEREEAKIKRLQVVAQIDENGNLIKILACGNEAEEMPNPNYCQNSSSNSISVKKNENIDYDLWQHFHPRVLEWEKEILEWARKFELPPNLIATIMQIESCGKKDAVSEAGAQGLFQVMPFHFEEGEDALDPETNAKRGLTYLKMLWEEAKKVNPNDPFDQIVRTLAGYNAGLTQVAESWENWPEETKRYALLWGARIFRDAENKADESAALSSWLLADGGKLCQSQD